MDNPFKSVRTEEQPSKVVVIGSVLKPVDDPRASAKIAQTLSQANKYRLHIIGFFTKKVAPPTGQTWHPLFRFSRLSLRRLAAPWVFLRRLIKLSPDLLIVNTHELLIVSAAYKILFGTRLIYDVRENYWRNLWYTQTFPWGLRHAPAIYVRMKEWATKPLVNHYWLAEAGYQREFSFHKPHFCTLENRYQGIIRTRKPFQLGNPLRLVYTGTLAEHYGVERIIHFTKEFSKHHSVHLTLIGYCPNRQFWHRIAPQIDQDDRFTVIGGPEWVPHDQIEAAIQQADAAIVGYLVDKSTENSLPTRLFEYLAHQIPILYPQHAPWDELLSPYPAGIPILFEKTPIEQIINQLSTTNFYQNAPNEGILWSSQGQKLLQSLPK